jgi:hypothetical protein
VGVSERVAVARDGREQVILTTVGVFLVGAGGVVAATGAVAGVAPWRSHRPTTSWRGGRFPIGVLSLAERWSPYSNRGLS